MEFFSYFTGYAVCTVHAPRQRTDSKKIEITVTDTTSSYSSSTITPLTSNFLTTDMTSPSLIVRPKTVISLSWSTVPKNFSRSMSTIQLRPSFIISNAFRTACCTKRSVTVGILRLLTPLSGFGISALRTGYGLYFLVRSCSLMFSPFSERYAPSSSTLIPFTLAAPLFLTTCRYAALEFSLLSICSIRLLVSIRCFFFCSFCLCRL